MSHLLVNDLAWSKGYRLVVQRKPLAPKHGWSTPTFNTLSEPVHIGELFVSTFVSTRILILQRLVGRWCCFAAAFLLWTSLFSVCVLLVLTLFAWFLRFNKIYGLNNWSFLSPGQIWRLDRYPQWFWVRWLQLIARFN